MKEKFYVSFEAARLLKEKGFNEPSEAVWCGAFGELKIEFPVIYRYGNSDYPDKFQMYTAPSKAEAIDWLESKGIVVEAFYITDGWFFSTNDLNIRQTTSSDNYFQTRLEAEDAAIIKALEML